MESLAHIDIKSLPWPLMLSATAVLISLVSLTFTVLTYRRGRPNVKATIKVIDLLPYVKQANLPSSIGVSLVVTNCGSAGTVIDAIVFQLKAIVTHPCVEDVWPVEPQEKTCAVSLDGFSSFRRVFRVPLSLPDGIQGDPRLSAEVRLGTDKAVTTRWLEIRESIFAHWSECLDTKLNTNST